MPFEDIGVCSDDHTISGFPSTWGWGEEESECRREMEILLNNCQWAEHNMALLSIGLIIQDHCIC